MATTGRNAAASAASATPHPASIYRPVGPASPRPAPPTGRCRSDTDSRKSGQNGHARRRESGQNGHRRHPPQIPHVTPDWPAPAAFGGAVPPRITRGLQAAAARPMLPNHPTQSSRRGSARRPPRPLRRHLECRDLPRAGTFSAAAHAPRRLHRRAFTPSSPSPCAGRVRPRPRTFLHYRSRVRAACPESAQADFAAAGPPGAVSTAGRPPLRRT
jgi:hypothetical protein